MDSKIVNNKVVDISKRTFISVMIILFTLMIATIVLTFVIPKGSFVTDSNGNILYNQYIKSDDQSGINIFKGIASPILVLFSSDGITIVMLCLFIISVTGCFQIMNDVLGIKIIINKLITKFEKRKELLISLIILIFMLFGSLLGLFEEVLTLLPIIIMLCISLGYDSYTGFLICIVATGFGFTCALTNPFTVLIASEIIKANYVSSIWLRIIIFITMYFVLFFYVRHYIKKISLDETQSYTYNSDLEKKENLQNIEIPDTVNQQKTFITYLVFLSLALTAIIAVPLIPVLRDYTVVFLIAIFLIGGIIAGVIASNNFKLTMKSFLKGFLSTIPAIAMLLLASSIKYILVEGRILPTIANYISTITTNKNPIVVVLLLFSIILFLEFFISSSTAKAMVVMGVLSVITLNISKETIVLTYLFGDGFTNVLFPTSPVLLIGLSMTGISYGKWLNKSKWLMILTFAIAIAFLILAVLIKY